MLGSDIYTYFTHGPPHPQYHLPGGAVLAKRSNWSGWRSDVYLWLGARRIINEPLYTVCANEAAVNFSIARESLDFYLYLYDGDELVEDNTRRYFELRLQTGLRDVASGYLEGESICNIGPELLLYGHPAVEDYPDFRE